MRKNREDRGEEKPSCREERETVAGGLNRMPKDLLTKILSRVSSASYSDLFSAQQTCKSLHEAGLDNCVLSHATMKEIEFVNWKTKKSPSMAFLNSLKESGNPEALFRLGMKEYFSFTKMKVEGLQFLKRAAEKGHALAMYVYGLILICYGGSDRANGMKILCCLEKKGTSREMVANECRKQIKPLVRQLWIKDCIVGLGRDEDSTSEVCEHVCILSRNKRGWRVDDEVDSSDGCNSCFWDQEGKKFCNMILKGSFES